MATLLAIICRQATVRVLGFNPNLPLTKT
ncbi:hypothetical protein CCACVL1_20846 [Corchorus capsularis]|uniref:Uncharacterized protein n=1 Tax=Corchorus capsularis TaxID=210143 RepID=A0A1R3H9K1_COCAP|nr:hypothetical protein CCACVL1_20846 [Corchorus capsularis]